MAPRLSLRGRLLAGTILWTVGLFSVTGVLFARLVEYFPGAPEQFHDHFLDTVPTLTVAALMMIIGAWQVYRGVSPINHLRSRLEAVRDGREQSLTGAYPSEVQPLVDDLNALLDHRERAIQRALAKAGDLAHGLKTPLAVLTNEVDRTRAAGHPELAALLGEQVARMRRQVEFHLAQARAAASGAAPGTRTPVRASVDGLVRTLEHLHHSRPLTIAVEVASDHAARARREDLDEMLGNLLDNAFKWARSRIIVSSSLTGDRLVIDVDDDGDGLPEAMREAVLGRGVRADERTPGSGLGLAIVRDVAAVYGGSIVLSASPLGGLRARLELPAG